MLRQENIKTKQLRTISFSFYTFLLIKYKIVLRKDNASFTIISTKYEHSNLNSWVLYSCLLRQKALLQWPCIAWVSYNWAYAPSEVQIYASERLNKTQRSMYYTQNLITLLKVCIPLMKKDFSAVVIVLGDSLLGKLWFCVIIFWRGFHCSLHYSEDHFNLD